MRLLENIRSKLLTSAAFLFAVGTIAPAFAVGPTSVTLDVYPQYNEYAASILNLTPASSATDFMTIVPSATKSVWLRRVTCTGTSTAAASLPVQLILRSTVDTGGTSTAPVLAPLFNAIGGGTGAAVAGTAVVAAYTANPTLGTSAGVIATGLLQTLAPASTGTSGLTFDFPLTDPSITPTLLKGSTYQIALNAGAASFGAGSSLSCTMLWSEH
jgi:hypothetical protein